MNVCVHFLQRRNKSSAAERSAPHLNGSRSHPASFRIGVEHQANAVACPFPPMSRFDCSDCDTWAGLSDSDVARASPRCSRSNQVGAIVAQARLALPTSCGSTPQPPTRANSRVPPQTWISDCGLSSLVLSIQSPRWAVDLSGPVRFRINLVI